MTLCAWCDDTIEAGAPALAAAPVSHGICRPCLDAQLAALQAPRPRAARTAGLTPLFAAAPVQASAAA
jgi:hypothetical protein